MIDPAQAAAALFATEGLKPRSWSSAPGDRYEEHHHDLPKVLICVAGGITFRTSDGDVPLGPGDRFDLPAGTAHAASVGPDGVTCLEAFR